MYLPWALSAAIFCAVDSAIPVFGQYIGVSIFLTIADAIFRQFLMQKLNAMAGGSAICTLSLETLRYEKSASLVREAVSLPDCQEH